MVTIHNVEQNSEAWFELRKQYPYTASNAYTMLTKGRDFKRSPFKGNKYTQRGHDLEPVALELVHKILKTESLPHGFVTNTKYPKAGASPDDLTIDTYIEVKCFNKVRHNMCAKEPFVEIIAQINHGLLITEYKKALLVLFNPDLPPHEALILKPIKPNKAIQNNLKRILLE